jgi:hypothetical protein
MFVCPQFAISPNYYFKFNNKCGPVLGPTQIFQVANVMLENSFSSRMIYYVIIGHPEGLGKEVDRNVKTDSLLLVKPFLCPV